MSWNDHDHCGEYAADSHYHFVADILGHDHDQSDLWSYVTDLANTVQNLRAQVEALQREQDNGAMSNWTHPVCELCWLADNPEGQPYRLRVPEPEACCRCGMETEAGIYVRQNPNELAHCGGHDD